MLKSKRLSESEIKENYEKANIKRKKKKLFSDIFIPILFVLMFLAIADFIMHAKGEDITIILAIIFVLTVTMIVWFELRRYKGKVTNKYYRNYRYEAKKLYNKLHTYSYNNRLLIQQSNYCYCFYCKSKIEARKIESYIDDNVTALCPNCGIDSIIPDCVEEEINDEIIDKMNKYWF